MTPLFADIITLRATIAPHMGERAFRAHVRELEQQGFPRRDTTFNGWYMPAVRAWLDARAGLDSHGAHQRPPPLPSLTPDGPEIWGTQDPAGDFHAREKRNARSRQTAA